MKSLLCFLYCQIKKAIGNGSVGNGNRQPLALSGGKQTVFFGGQWPASPDEFVPDETD